MKLAYFAETDTLSIQLLDALSAETEALSDHVTIDRDNTGEIIAIDIEHASKHVDLTSLHASSVPFTATA